MTKPEAIIQPSKLEKVRQPLSQLCRAGMTIPDARGHGREKGHGNLVDIPVDTIVKAAGEGKIGGGKIFLSRLAEAIRIRSEEHGVAAG
jgi:nitrogen regulatory protein P-II 1